MKRRAGQSDRSVDDAVVAALEAEDFLEERWSRPSPYNCLRWYYCRCSRRNNRLCYHDSHRPRWARHCRGKEGCCPPRQAAVVGAVVAVVVVVVAFPVQCWDYGHPLYTLAADVGRSAAGRDSDEHWWHVPALNYYDCPSAVATLDLGGRCHHLGPRRSDCGSG